MTLIKISFAPTGDGSHLNEEAESGFEQNEDQNMRVLVESASLCQSYSPSGELLKTSSAENMKDFQWYFESYVIDEPFASARAQVIQRRLRTQGKLLLENFLRPHICRHVAGSDNLFIKILTPENNPELAKSPLNLFFWEILEDRSVWQDVFHVKPNHVTVVRAYERKEALAVADNVFEACKADLRTYSVLAITARPSYTNDIPHRLITRSISAALDTILQNSTSTASLEIVRPGTYDALVHHLQRHPKGHYDIVHLDLHGDADDRGAHLVFTKSGQLANLQPENISAEKVAFLLAKYGVTTVVINACRSATASDGSSNIASLLVRSGIKVAIGMSFNVLSLSADQFMRDFYNAFLGQSASAVEAVSFARDRMRQDKGRMSKYHTQIEIEDHLVPILHCQESELQEFIQCFPKPADRSQKETLSENIASIPKMDFIGREGDLLRLEWMLSQFPKVTIHVQGAPGIGKTRLLREAADWWQKTGLFPHVLFLQLTGPRFQDCTVREILDFIGEQLATETKNASTVDLVSVLNRHSFLLILDSFDTIKWSTKCSQSEHEHQFRLWLRKLKSSSVVVLSRTPDHCLGSVIQVRLLLRPLNISHAIAAGTNILQKNPVPSHLLTTQEDRSMFEQLIGLSGGNPLAIKVLMYDLLKHLAQDRALTLSSHLLSLLQLRPIYLDIENCAGGGGARAVAELLDEARRCLEMRRQDDIFRLKNARDFESKENSEMITSEKYETLSDMIEILNEREGLVNGQPRRTHTEHNLESGFFPAMVFLGFWHNMIYQIEPFVITLTTLLVARRDLRDNEFIRFRNRLCKFTEESEQNADYINTELLHKDRFGLSPMLARHCLYLGRQAFAEFNRTLSQKLTHYVDGPHEQMHGTSAHHFKESYFSLSPLLSLVFQSCAVRGLFPGTVAEDVEVARDSLYRKRTSTWFLYKANFPASHFSDALRMEINYDFFNCLCFFLSHQHLDSWQTGFHWHMQYIIGQAIALDARRVRLVERVLNRFIRTCMQRIGQIRRKFRDPQTGGYQTEYQRENWKEWEMVADLEVACASAILRAMYCLEILQKPLDHYKMQWKSLSFRPMFLHFKEMDPDLRELTIRSLSVNSRWFDATQNGVVSDVATVQQYLMDGQALLSDQRKWVGLQPPQATLDDSLAPSAQVLELSNTLLGGKGTILYRASHIMTQIGESREQDALRKAIVDLEDLLAEELEQSIDVHTRYQIHLYLAFLHDRSGNKALAVQHRTIREDLELMLEPGVAAQIKQYAKFWKTYSRTERRSKGEPANRTQILERQLNLQKAQLAEAESQYDASKLKVLELTDEIANTLVSLGRYAEAIHEYDRVIDGRQQVLPTNDRETLSTRFARSKALSQLQRYDESIPELRMLREAYASLGEWKIHSNVTGTLGLQLFNEVELSTSSRSESMGDPRLVEATTLLGDVADSAQDLYEPGDKNIAIRMSNSAAVYAYQEQFDKAETLYQSALRVHHTRTSDEADESLISAQNSIASLWVKTRKFQDAEELFKRILAITIDEYEPWQKITLTIMGNIHDLYLKSGAEEKAASFIQEYISRFNAALQSRVLVEKEGQPDFLRPKYELGEKLAACKVYVEAVTLLEEVSTAWLAEGKRDEESVMALRRLYNCYYAQEPRLLERAFIVNNQLIDCLKLIGGPDHADTLNAMNSQVVCLRDMGRMNEATELQQHVIKTRKRTLGNTHEFTLNNTSFLADLFGEWGDWASALRERQKVYDSREAISPNSLVTLAQASRLAICHENLDQWDRVVEVRRKEYDGRCEIQGPNSALLVLNELAFALDKVGNHVEAKASINKTIDGRTELLGPAHVDTLTSQRFKARICRNLQELVEAEEILHDVLAKRAEDPTIDFTSGMALAGLSQVYKAKGETERAIELSKKAIATLEEVQGVVPNLLLEGLVVELAREYAASQRWRQAKSEAEKALTKLQSQRATLTVTRKMAECKALLEEARSNEDRVSEPDVKDR